MQELEKQAKRLRRMIEIGYHGDAESEARTIGRSVSMNPNPFIVLDEFEQALQDVAAELQRLRSERDALQAEKDAAGGVWSRSLAKDTLAAALDRAEAAEAALAQRSSPAAPVKCDGKNDDPVTTPHAALVERLRRAADGDNADLMSDRLREAARALSDLSWLRPVLAERLTDEVLQEARMEYQQIWHQESTSWEASNDAMRRVLLDTLCPAARTEETNR